MHFLTLYHQHSRFQTAFLSWKKYTAWGITSTDRWSLLGLFKCCWVDSSTELNRWFQSQHLIGRGQWTKHKFWVGKIRQIFLCHKSLIELNGKLSLLSFYFHLWLNHCLQTVSFYKIERALNFVQFIRKLLNEWIIF